jgi:hypothetical protein
MVSTGEDQHAERAMLNVNAWQRKVLSWISPDSGLSDECLIRKGAWTATLVPSLRFLDWVLVGITASLYSLLKYYSFTDIGIWVILWILNLIVSGSVVVFNDRYKIDITLMQTLRRLVTAMFNKSQPVGLALETIIFFRLLLWDGADQFIIFFRERLSNGPVQVAVFVAASGLQMFVWTKIYSLGYEGILELLKAVAGRSI